MVNHYRRTTYYIAVSGIFLGLTLIFQYLERYMPLIPGIANINLSTIFIVPLFFITPFRYGFIVLIARFIIGPAFSNSGYSPIGIWGHFILLIATLIFAVMLFLFKKYKLLHIKKHFIKLSIVISIVTCSVIMTLLNGILFTPVYFWLFATIDSPSFIELSNNWSGNSELFFGIKNYWGAIVSVFMALNLINYSISGFLFYFINKRMKWSHISK